MPTITSSTSPRARVSEAEREQRARARQEQRIARHRERALDAVAACFADRGYHDTTVEQVVARAHTSKSAFYACFPNKEMAFAALLEREGERLLRGVEDALRQEGDPQRRAGTAISRFVLACVHDRAVARILLVESVGISPAIEDRRRRLHQRFAGMVRRQVEGRPEGPPAGVDLDVLCWAIVGAVNEAVLRLLEVGGDPGPTITALEHVARRALLS